MNHSALMDAVDKDTALPLYQQIKNDIRDKIGNREWTPGHKIPSENALVDSLGVSRMTIHRALRELTQEGLLNRVHGLGTFVAKPARHASLINLQDIAEEIHQAGFRHRCKVLGLKTINASKTIAETMEVSPDTSLFHLRAVHYQENVAIQLEDRLVNPLMVPEFDQIDFDLQTATEYLIGLGKPEEMEHIVQATLPDKSSAKHLGISQAEPCLKLTRRTWQSGSIVTRVVLMYPGDRYDLGQRYRTDQYATISPMEKPHGKQP